MTMSSGSETPSNRRYSAITASSGGTVAWCSTTRRPPTAGMKCAVKPRRASRSISAVSVPASSGGGPAQAARLVTTPPSRRSRRGLPRQGQGQAHHVGRVVDQLEGELLAQLRRHVLEVAPVATRQDDGANARAMRGQHL